MTAASRDQPIASARAIAIGATSLLAIVFMLITTLAGVDGAALDSGSLTTGRDGSASVSALASREIPPVYLRLYLAAAQRYGLDWAVLAAIGKVECDHGRDPDPSCHKEGAVNGAGAGGPMQFIASTWARYGVDGNGDGRIDRWDAADAIFSASNYLRASGCSTEAIHGLSMRITGQVDTRPKWSGGPPGTAAPQSRRAPLSAGSEREGGEEGADTRLQGESPTSVRFVSGERAALVPGEGHVAVHPHRHSSNCSGNGGCGQRAATPTVWARRPSGSEGALEEDCSSTINYVLYRSGVRPIAEIVRDNPLAQDYVRWGLPGPGRWVAIYAAKCATNHVFIVLAGLRLDTSHNGTDVGPSRNEDGPRWRILDHIPTWAHWSVRHPPGL